MSPAITVPGQTLLSYHIYSEQADITGLADGGLLRDVITDPVISTRINDGPSSFQLKLATWPSNLSVGNLVQLRRADGSIVGTWKYEDQHVQNNPDKLDYEITMTPLRGELNEVDFEGNYTAVSVPPLTTLGLHTWSRWIRDALVLTKHCRAGDIIDDGTNNPYTFRQSNPQATLNQATALGGAGWWWSCDAQGVVTVQTVATAPTTHYLTQGREIVSMETTTLVTPAINVVRVTGGVPTGKTLPILAEKVWGVDAGSPTDPLAAALLGRRCKWYSDGGIIDQATANKIALQLLIAGARASKQRRLRSVGSTDRFAVGDHLYLRSPSLDPGSPNVAVLGPLIIIEVNEYGGTGIVDLLCNDDLYVSPFHNQAQINPGGSSGPVSPFPTGLGGGGGGGGGTGAACGGMAQFFELAGDVTPTLSAGNITIESGTFVVDGATGASLIAIIDASVKTASVPGGYLGVGVNLGGAVSQIGRVRMSGEWESVTRRVTSAQLIPGTYTATAYLTNPGNVAGTAEVVYDLNVYIV